MLVALSVGLYYLLKTPEEGEAGSNLVKALTWRIGIWVVLFGYILISIKMGWIIPSSSINPHNFNAEQQQRMESVKAN